MEYKTCAQEVIRPDSHSTDFPNLKILGELAAKCEEFSAGMGEVECPQTITEVLGLMAQILGGLCLSGLKALADPEIEEPEPEPESEYQPESEFEPEPEPEVIPDPDEDSGLTPDEFDELDESEQNAISWDSRDHEEWIFVGRRHSSKWL